MSNFTRPPRRLARALALASLPAVALLAGVGQAGAASFSNTTGFSLPGGSGTLGNASVYPSAITVSGLTGGVQKATVTLKGFAHQCPIDDDLLLVSPAGRSTILMSDAGDCANEVPLRPAVDLTFDDAVSTLVPCLDFNSTPPRLPGGTYAPTDYSPAVNGQPSVCDPSTDRDHHSPAYPGAPGALANVFTGLVTPVGGWAHSMAAFNNTDPNGTWLLYATDQYSMSTGKLAGWTLNVTSSTAQAPPPPPIVPQRPNISAKLVTSALKKKQKVLAQRGVRAVFTSSVAGHLLASGRVKVGKTYKFKSVKSRVVAQRRTTVTLKLPSSGLKAVRKALAKHKKVKAKITLVVTTATGIKTTVSKTVTLVR